MHALLKFTQFVSKTFALWTSTRSGYAGDLICRVVIETPVNLNKEQKELLEKLEESLKGQKSHSPKSSSFLDSVKKFFDNLGK